jgi:hypothetical protein
MRRWPFLGLAATATAAGLTGLAPAQASTQPGWRIWQTTGVPAVASYYSAVAALGSGDAWVAGGATSNAKQLPTEIVKHWTGRSWSPLPLPSSVAARWGGQAAVAASSPTDALVVGPNEANSGSNAVRWNGKQWSTSSLSGATLLNDAIFSATDAWAFGSAKGSPAYAVHYNGRSWAKSSIPVIAGQTHTVSAVSGGDVWAVGVSPATAAKGPGAQVTEAAYYDGKAWKAVPITNLRLASQQSLYFPTILALSAKNVWVYSGLQGFLPGAGWVPLPDAVLTHWNGKTWSRVTIPYATGQTGYIAADGDGGVWLSASTKGTSYLYHDNDGKWTSTATPTVKGYTAYVTALAEIPGTTSVWAVGELISKASNLDTRAVIWKYGA